MREFPFSIDNPEGDVFVRRAREEMKQHSLVVARFLDDFEAWSLRLVNEIGVKYIELCQNISFS